MALLPNHKHERFAQLIAKGWKKYEAYEEVGYAGGNRSAATRLAQRPDVAARIVELQATNAAPVNAIQSAKDGSLADMGLTMVWVAEAYLTIHSKALEARRFKEANDALSAIAKLVKAERSEGADAPAQFRGPAISVADTLALLSSMKDVMHIGRNQ